jgi:hypothetical protein
MEQKHIRFNMMIDAEKHKKFKSICSLSGKTMSEVVLDLLDVFITAVEEEDEN